MRVLMHCRPDWRAHPGGDVVQLRRWTVWLRRLGVDARWSEEPLPDLTGVDLVHLHNLSRAYQLWPTLDHCRRSGVPVALTPLYWPVQEFERQGYPGMLGILRGLLPAPVWGRVKAAARLIRNPNQRGALLKEIWSGSTALARQFLRGVSGLIPNSHAEIEPLARMVPDIPPAHVVHSGVDAYFWSDDRELWKFEWSGFGRRRSLTSEQAEAIREPSSELESDRQGVLCVARFDPQKGQHRLIQALQGLDIPLTLAGTPNPNHRGYRRLCQSLAGANVHIVGRQRLIQLKRLYWRHRVFALCSWFEISALSGLEAACSGAQVVMTSRGGWREYGGELARYVDPADLQAVRQAIVDALECPACPELAQRIRNQFTWEQSARRLVAAYEAILKRARRWRRAA